MILRILIILGIKGNSLSLKRAANQTPTANTHVLSRETECFFLLRPDSDEDAPSWHLHSTLFLGSWKCNKD